MSAFLVNMTRRTTESTVTEISYFHTTIASVSFTSTDKFEPVLLHPIILYTLCAINLLTILGNLLVMLAVFKDHRLRLINTNLIIASLALSDFLIGVVVLPSAISVEYTSGYWYFGRNWCDIWHAMDVLCCTASILNLCIISFDRYWAITSPISYRSKMTKRVASILIAFVWVCSSAISFPAIVWWRKVDPPFIENQCIFTGSSTYLLFSSVISFYLPCAIMVFTYLRVYLTAISQMRGILAGTKNVATASKDHEKTVNLRIHRGGFVRNNLTNNMKQEHKAAKTLGIVMGIFVICWLPFFVTSPLSAICIECIKYPQLIIPIMTWLGWSNSALNPFIYAFVSRHFRMAFYKILCSAHCTKRSISHPSTVIAALSRGVINATFVKGEEDFQLSTGRPNLQTDQHASPKSRL
ncbi:dopamine receptor 2-like [Anneissia japonica]|uniref:dopamine receptor 2-like n=1 Tax=Anneissia japonica TaxID=1529436 RepID=UPI0014259455|nr:dopamine receptor 2-like [Anneissia japonica]